jgi:uncharacterized protein (PEP-CTERM system associated)
VNSIVDKGEDASVRAIHWFSKWLNLNLGVDFSRDKYDSDGRKDYTYSYVSQLEYSYQKWIKMYLAYKYRNRDSNIPFNEYCDNVYNFGASIIF